MTSLTNDLQTCLDLASFRGRFVTFFFCIFCNSSDWSRFVVVEKSRHNDKQKIQICHAKNIVNPPKPKNTVQTGNLHTNWWSKRPMQCRLIKGRPCGLTNWIVNDSDFKPSEFKCRLRSDSDSNDEIISTIAILISFFYIFD